jgi:hypothetical protein
MSPPKKKQQASSTPLLRLGYYVLDLAQAPFDWLFWLIEKPKCRLWHRLHKTGRANR